ncbi:SGNH hydrolase domain-containing protein [Paractinoplanes maris]|uniref:SGNH hydrolase domain-containing protein n=1 Tax=Paractinoplanes maris TaxID=1734446 RepID=UPI00202296CB|nr:SGNH hydrolase domain-containing protein [Actinoplanes maris]
MARRESTRTSRTVPMMALLGVIAGCTASVPPPPRAVAPPAPRIGLTEVVTAVRQATVQGALPADLTPSLATTAEDLGFDNETCEAGPKAVQVEPCVFGDRASAIDVVLYGDSHAGMWLPALSAIAERRDWRLQFFGKPACPALAITFWNQQEQRPFTECDRFREFVAGRVAAIKPELVIVTNESFSQKHGRAQLITSSEWRTGLTETLRTLRRFAGQVVVLGNTPVLDQSAPECLAAHPDDIKACTTSRADATARLWNDAEADAAEATGTGYISVLPWLCTAVCTPVIGNVTVYRNRFHLTATYARMLNGVLEEALLEHFPQDAVPALVSSVGDAG